jgi:hypothetical protein
MRYLPRAAARLSAMTVCAVMCAYASQKDPPDMHPPPPERILVPAYLEAASGTGVVSLTRDAGSEYSACTLEVKVGGRPVVLLRPSEGVTLHLPPGKHRFSVTGDGSNVCGPGTPEYAEVRTQSVTVAPEHPVDVRIGFGRTGRIYLTVSAS